MRLFVAIDLGDEVRAAIAAEQRRVGEALGGARSTLRWVRPEHAHLTLVFLGEVDEARGGAVVEVMSNPLDQPAFDLVLGGLGVFPPQGAPRVLWLGVTSGAREVGEVQRVAAARLAGLGVTLEARTFHPHLTLARWRAGRPADRRRVMTADRGVAIARAEVTAITLYQSRLSSSGPTYTSLARASLV